jgi:hypothetical protein
MQKTRHPERDDRAKTNDLEAGLKEREPPGKH